MRALQTPLEAAGWLRGLVRGTLCSDSRKLRHGDGFIAWPGATSDARAHVRAALAQGAAACLVEGAGVKEFAFDSERVASYTGLKAASALVACDFFGQPSQELAVLAVTGTNGKTSTVWWLAQALSNTAMEPALRCAMVGTLGIGLTPSAHGHGDDPASLQHLLSTGLTTPDPVLLQASLRGFVDSGMQACALEASSIGLDEHRLDGTRIRTAIFTNFTQDHLDYHGNMAAYWRAKEGQEQHRLQTPLVGLFNVSNLLGVLAAMRTLGVALADAVAACRDLLPVPGRMQCVSEAGKPMAVVDYAHTPDALAQALEALRALSAARAGRLWCVFGCGGDRDPSKRALMGAAAARGADRIVLTSDNPRGEDPLAIIDQIAIGLADHPEVMREPDRGQAIDRTLALADVRDVVLVAGKGHEAYQETAGTRRPFSDLQRVRCALAIRHGAPTGMAV
ncbi:MAG: UDP-N-acetylmuramoyl-L-alanyl-D-glutamate--2,6-diaminopimelate ligase [Betaproteobacteria bacterium]|nr:UDP-N-acetylmuramoyl-L-alanyl-D-glutamate--2,6-diaminopimelate ligase [Betaproteobacteria bacterium]